MVTCPNCGKPVSGRARVCGYCGESLVSDYFSGHQQARTSFEKERPGPGAIAGTTLGAFGGVSLLAVLVFHILVLCGVGEIGPLPALELDWCVRTALLAILVPVYLAQMLILHGRRLSWWPDLFWLFMSVTALGVVIQGYIDQGTSLFYDVLAIPYLLAVGMILIAVGAITSIFSYKRSR